MNRRNFTRAALAALVCSFVAIAPLAHAEDLDPALQPRLDAIIRQARAWAGDATLIDAVRARHAATPPHLAALTEAQWQKLTVMDPIVREFTKHAAAQLIKTQRPAAVTEAFLSAADGTKVAFLSKTTSWSHHGKAKHDEPMAGRVWQGPVELDESTGLKQLQIAVPVLDGDKPLGSLVVGVSLARLE